MDPSSTSAAFRPRIVVLDAHTLDPGDNPWDELAALGELELYPRTAPDELLARAQGADVLLVNKTRLGETEFAALTGLRLVCVLATGYDVVDVAAARKHGVSVCNVPEYGTASVAEHTLALCFALARRVELQDTAVRNGDWNRSGDFSYWASPQQELAGRCMALLGFGKIARRVARLARALEMNVIAHDPFVQTDAVVEGVELVDVDALFERADILSLHCPLSPSNRHLVNRQRLASMKRSAWLVNTARGALLDEDALLDALERGVIEAAALDVLEREPIAPEHPLLRCPRLLLSPHLAWATLAARRRLMASTAANLRAFLAGRAINVLA